jgi:hypothetical protein
MNKERANKMSELGLMTEYGQKLINIAKSLGHWETTEKKIKTTNR